MREIGRDYCGTVVIKRSWIYVSVADGGSESVMAVLAYTGVTVLITTNEREGDLLRCVCVVFFPSSMLHSGDKPFSSLLAPM